MDLELWDHRNELNDFDTLERDRRSPGVKYDNICHIDGHGEDK